MGEQAHRAGCPACRLGRTVEGARTLAGLEARAVAWFPAAELAELAGCGEGAWWDHLRAYRLDEARTANVEGAAARALELAIAGDPAARLALSAVDRLREARRGPGPASPGTNGGQFQAPGGPVPDWPGESG